MSTTTAVILFLMAGPGHADLSGNKAEDLDKARELVKQLADSRFRVRDAAEKALLELGPASIAALKEGETNPDFHVQERCKALQPLIRDLVMQRRIDAFVNSTDGSIAKDLPLAASFIKAAGDSRDSRALYADVFSQNAALLDLVTQDNKKAIAQFVQHCNEIVHRHQMQQVMNPRLSQQVFSKAEVAFFFLMASELSTDRTGRASSFGYAYIRAPILVASLSKETAANLPLRKLFLHWLEKEPQPHMVQQGLQVAVEIKMKEALPLVLKMVKEKTVPIYSRAESTVMLAKIGNKEHVKEIESLLEDKTLVTAINLNNKKGTVQLRDIALAVCVKLRGQKMKDYDFDMMQGNNEDIMSYVNCAFTSDAKREAALKKYKDLIANEAKK